MKQKQKIAVYSGDIPSTTFIERLIRGLSQRDLQIMLFGFLKTSNPSYNNSVTLVAYKNTRFQKVLHLLKYTMLLVLFRFKDKRKLDSILKTSNQNTLREKVKYYPVLWHKPDVFHLQWAKGISDWIWVKEFGIKLILSLRGAHINYSPIADETLAETYTSLFPHVDGFHAVSKAIAKEAVRYGAPEDRIKVVYSGLDVNPSEDSNSTSNKIFNIVSIGRSHWVKGYSYAIDMCKILKEANVNFKYTIIGGDDSVELSYQINDLGLEAHVELLGQMPFKTVKSFIERSDLLLLSSVKEGVANVVLEAMALKTLVLATDSGGMAEVITPYENGYLSTIRDPESLASKVLEIIDLKQDKRNSILENAYEYIQDHHRQDTMINGMCALYDNTKIVS
ncbi:glycosyltransferase family 4 protein [Psychroserpens sp.]|uniref:glycosyltransferase family 4 protein n=1 Tax=Psychroserpens sp. TaxID=2020870 RepID=UPI001B2749A5|nr:glycosyltransferase family 4 protein [Psychroserpens sp.]MBO6630995.1 glycosyltransferase family 4 protein [Psychroserpens sp.]MBO6654110.1 glycosyltransferase family 4 protein [Psychroserpens sp.]